MTDEETADPVDTCKMALDAAAEKGLSYCETDDALYEAMADQFGLDVDTVDDADAILLDGPDRADPEPWVLCRSVELIEEDDLNPVAAVNQAWSEVSTDVPDEESDADDEQVEEDDTSEESTDEDLELTDTEEEILSSSE